jgi:hypothetical protein
MYTDRTLMQLTQDMAGAKPMNSQSHGWSALITKHLTQDFVK